MRSHRDAAVRQNMDRSHHFFLPFFGDAHSKTALRLVLQLAENPEVTATIVRFGERDSSFDSSAASGIATEQTNIIIAKSAGAQALTTGNEAAFFATMQKSLPTELQGRVIFESVASASPIQDAVARAQEEVGQDPKNGGDVVVVGRRTTATDSGTLGSAADAFIAAGIRASLLVLQARGSVE